MEPAAKKRRCYPTNPQKMRLIQLLQLDDELRGGKFSATFTKKVAEARWAALASELNSIPGAKKDWTGWRRTWQDMKSKTKRKETAVRRSYNGTGGGSGDDNILILNTINKTDLELNSEIKESLGRFKDLPESSKMLFPDLPVLPTTITENIDKKKAFKKKTTVKKRLDRSLDTDNVLKEKNKYKKIFYENYIVEMRRQTVALLLIANNLKKE